MSFVFTVDQMLTVIESAYQAECQMTTCRCSGQPVTGIDEPAAGVAVRFKTVTVSPFLQLALFCRVLI